MPDEVEELLYGNDSIVDSLAGFDLSHLEEVNDDFADNCNEEYEYD